MSATRASSSGCSWYAKNLTLKYRCKDYISFISWWVQGKVNKTQQVRVWHVEPSDGGQLLSRLMRTIKLRNDSCAVASLAADESMQVLAIGYQDGQLEVIRGDLVRGRGLKQKMISLDQKHPLHAVFLRPLASSESMANQQTVTERFKVLGSRSSNVPDVLLFVVSEQRIHSVRLQFSGEHVLELERGFGCPLASQATLLGDGSEAQLALGRPDGLFLYQADGRGPCLAVDGSKQLLAAHKRFLAVIGDETDEKASKTSKSPIVSVKTPSQPIRSVVSIYDVRHRYVAFSGTFEPIRRVFSAWGSILLLTRSGRLIELREQDAGFQLELLFRKQQFALAAELASKHLQLGPDALVHLFRQYGDHLLRAGDVDGAVSQYVRTIGTLEPSYVVRRLLQGQRLRPLSVYLEQLHRRHVATRQHTELLISCLARLGEKERLSVLLHTSPVLQDSAESTKSITTECAEVDDEEDGAINIPDTETQFDVTGAVNVLRQSRLPKLALQLAQQHCCFESAVRIALDELHDTIAAIDVLSKAVVLYKPPSSLSIELLQLISRYGRRLLTSKPDETFSFVQNVCNQWASQDSDKEEKDRSGFLVGKTSPDISFDPPDRPFSPASLIDIFVQDPLRKRRFLRFLIETHPNCADTSVYNALLELDLRVFRQTEPSDPQHEMSRQSLVELLTGSTSIDLDQAVVLCRTSGFREGVLLLYERMQLYELLLMEHANHDPPDFSDILRICRQFGNLQPSLWIRAFGLLMKLSFDTTRFEVDDDDLDISKLALTDEPNPPITAESVLISVLKYILDYRLISLCSVIRLLGENPTIPIRALDAHLKTCLSQESEILNEQKSLVKDHERDTQRTRQLLEALQSQPIVLQTSKCSVCGHSLDLPAVHFLCLHAFHRQCFDSHSGEHDSACPLCLPEQKRLQRLLNISERNDRQSLQRQFVQQLVDSPSSPITTVARFFTQRVFD